MLYFDNAEAVYSTSLADGSAVNVKLVGKN